MMAVVSECSNKLKGKQYAGQFFGQQINDKLHEEGSYVWKFLAYMSILRNILYKK
jgi:DUF971 family protein